MAYIKTVSEDQTKNVTQELYKTARESIGYIHNYVKTFSLQPEVYEAWSKLLGEFQSHMRLRRCELMIFTTALALKCTYWLLAHVTILLKNFSHAEQIIAIVKYCQSSDPTPEEVALMAVTQKSTKLAIDKSEADVEALSANGLLDREILDVVFTCTAHKIFSKTHDAFTSRPDEMYLEREPDLDQILAMGNSFPLQLKRKNAIWKLIKLKLVKGGING